MNEKLDEKQLSEIEHFIEGADISGYQKLTLPNGRVIPGEDRLPAANLIFPGSLSGKSVLDVGCHHGFFLHEAVRRGATRAVGLEMDHERFKIANTIAPLWDGKIEILEGLVEEVPIDEQFDLVLFLNVLHHVSDPVMVMRRLADLCRGTVIVEFRQPHDPQFIQAGLHGSVELTHPRASFGRRAVRRVRRQAEAPIMELISRRLPVVGVGSLQYDRSYFFSQKAFYNMFVVHNRIFDTVDFRPSTSRGQALAFCKVKP